MKTGTKTSSASGYIRRSAIDERGEDASIKYQMRYCEELAARHGLQITEWFNEGDGSPASVFKENERPAYDRALAGLGHSYSTLAERHDSEFEESAWSKVAPSTAQSGYSRWHEMELSARLTYQTGPTIAL